MLVLFVYYYVSLFKSKIKRRLSVEYRKISMLTSFDSFYCTQILLLQTSQFYDSSLKLQKDMKMGYLPSTLLDGVACQLKCPNLIPIEIRSQAIKGEKAFLKRYNFLIEHELGYGICAWNSPNQNCLQKKVLNH